MAYFYQEVMAEIARVKSVSTDLTYVQAYEKAKAALPDRLKAEEAAVNKAFMKEHPLKAWSDSSINRIVSRLTDKPSTVDLEKVVMDANPMLGEDPSLIHKGDTLHLENLPVSEKGMYIYKAIVAAQTGEHPLDGNNMQMVVDRVVKQYNETHVTQANAEAAQLPHLNAVEGMAAEI